MDDYIHCGFYCCINDEDLRENIEYLYALMESYRPYYDRNEITQAIEQVQDTLDKLQDDLDSIREHFHIDWNAKVGEGETRVTTGYNDDFT